MRLMRLVTSAQIRDDPDAYKDVLFIDGKAVDAYTFCKQEVEPAFKWAGTLLSQPSLSTLTWNDDDEPKQTFLVQDDPQISALTRAFSVEIDIVRMPIPEDRPSVLTVEVTPERKGRWVAYTMERPALLFT